MGGVSNLLPSELIGHEDDVKPVEGVEGKGHQLLDGGGRGALPALPPEGLLEHRRIRLTQVHNNTGTQEKEAHNHIKHSDVSDISR